MKKGSFVFGLLVGIAAGVAGKMLYDNREEVVEIIMDTAKIAKDEIADVVDYAGTKVGAIGDEIGKKSEQDQQDAQKQLEEIKEALDEEIEETK